MAKGNMLLGMARGSVGDVTFYRDGGLQRARSRNRQPNNPRSNKQQTQRALFANCVKFYKLTAAKFFRFAFENKKVNESDYNAFMRENLKRGVMMSKTAFYCEPYPALGNWLVSRGSLATLPNYNNDNYYPPRFDLGAPYTETPASTITIGDISTAMIASGRYQVGDIITMLKYLSNGDNIPSATPNAETDLLQTNFVFWQFLVDPNNTATFASIFGDIARFHIVKTSQGNLAIEFGASSTSAAGEEWRLGYQAMTIIHSRNTANGLLVSTQELTCNPRYTDAITTATTDATYKSAVLTDWSASGLAILQGEGLDLVDPNDFGDYVLGTRKGADNEITITNITGASAGDSWALYIQSTKQLSDEQVRLILRKSIVSSEGMQIDYDANVETDSAPSSLFGYSCELLTTTSLPASITLRLQSGATRNATYTA